MMPSFQLQLVCASLILSGLLVGHVTPVSAQTQRTTGTMAARPAPIGALSTAELADRRSALARLSPADVILAMGAPEPREDYIAFNQSPSFRYLTDVREPEAALLGVRDEGGAMTWTLFVQPRDPAREVWTGRRVGAERAQDRWGIRGRARTGLNQHLDSVLAKAKSFMFVGDNSLPGDETADDRYVNAVRARYPSLTVTLGTSQVSRLRAFKSAAELQRIRRSAEITVEAMEQGSRHVAPDTPEFMVDAAVSYAFRAAGSERASFASIVGSGPNGTTLHYNANDRTMLAGELVVVDIGASYEGYAADMTRTFPVSGRFTPAQREVYQVVRDAQAAAERQAKAGAKAFLMTDSSTAVLAAGLTRLGLIESPTATYDCSSDGSKQCRQVSLFYMHGLGHGIGLEVHDPDQYYFAGNTLGIGSVFTLEPGIYVRANLLDLIPRTVRNAQLAATIGGAIRAFADTGVRIEDDYIITANGAEWITRGPREIAEIESMLLRRTAK